MKSSKIKSIFIILLIYLAATLLGIYVFNIFDNLNMLLRLFGADVAATILVWLFSVIFKNSSIYDPYWSVLPVVLFALLIAMEKNYSIEAFMLFIPVCYWALRLTANWALMFENLTTQDWRYDKYKNDFPRLWPIINFAGIQLMPTIIVYLAVIPGIIIVTSDFEANVFTLVAMLITIAAPTLQLCADLQRYSFAKKNKGKVCNIGLWKISRHPNYLGEILMWWGVFFMLLSMSKDYWWTGIGALLNNLLFIFVSIPLMERRQINNKPDYSEYLKETGKLLPKFKRT